MIYADCLITSQSEKANAKGNRQMAKANTKAVKIDCLSMGNFLII